MALLPEKTMKWYIVHKLSKPILINSIGYLRDMFKDVIAEKEIRGWVNPEAKLLYDLFTIIIERDEIMRGDENDHIRQFWLNTRDIGTTIVDEDSHYMLRLLYFIELVHEFYPLFKIEMHRNRAYWDWEHIFAGLQKNEPNDKKAGYSATYQRLKAKLDENKGDSDSVPDGA